jgi:adenosylcobinamide-phosphate synthase
VSLLSLIIALLLEQWRPLSDRRNLLSPLTRYAAYFEQQFNAGEAYQGQIAWALAVVPLVLVSWLVYWLALHVTPLLALAINVAALYVTMGFRQSSHFFTGIRLALRDEDLPRARDLLAQWRGHNCDTLTREEVVRLAIESALLASHRQVFAVAFWFAVLPGPSGAILYRLAAFLNWNWGNAAGTAHETRRFGKFARDAFAVLEWIPARVTAAAFAVVGDFEDAVYCWRTQAGKWAEQSMGIVLAAGAGAIGVRLGTPIVVAGELVDRPELGVGDPPDVPHLDTTIGLVWRALVLYLLMLLIIGVAKVVS